MHKKCTLCIDASIEKNACRAFYKKPFQSHNLAMRLRAIREAAGLSQKQLAEMMGVDQSTVQRAETMHASAKISTYARAAEVLEVPLEAMFNTQRDLDELLLLETFRRLPPNMRRSVLQLAQSVLQESYSVAHETPETDGDSFEPSPA